MALFLVCYVNLISNNFIKKIYSITLVFLFIALSCEDDSSIDTKKISYQDDISDITFINNSFYTTNYDLSGNAGNQIDLIVLGLNENGSFLDDSFHLELNGQGYFSITNDGTDLYLQSRTTQLIFKSSAIGELSFSKYISESSHRDELFEMTSIETSNIGIFSLSHHNSNLYMLAFKENEDALITMDYNNLTVLDTEIIGDSTF